MDPEIMASEEMVMQDRMQDLNKLSVVTNRVEAHLINF